MHNSMQRRERLGEAGVKWVESLLLGAVLAMGGGESARAKGGAWERVKRSRPGYYPGSQADG